MALTMIVRLLGHVRSPIKAGQSACQVADDDGSWEGWAYQATVIDLASGRVVGWAIADHMRAELVTDVSRMAIEHRRPGPGLVFHPDRGTQYTSRELTGLLAQHEMVQSLSQSRRCWDDAVAGSFFATLKGELIDRQSGSPEPADHTDALEMIRHLVIGQTPSPVRSARLSVIERATTNRPSTCSRWAPGPQQDGMKLRSLLA